MAYISIIIPCRNERKFIQSIIKNIVEQDIDKDQLEIFFIDGNSTDGTKEIIDDFSKKYDFIKIIDNPQKTVPFALNLGIENSTGEILIRLDAHAIYPNDYISKLVYYLNKLNADNVGGAVITIPSNPTKTAKSIAIALSSPFGVGNSYFRTDLLTHKEFVQVDTVPFGCYKKEVFERIGSFDIDLIRNQDNEFNERLIKNGGKIYLIPSIKIQYFARESYQKLFKMFYQYGYFGPLVDIKLKKPTRLRRYIPTLFVLSLIMLIFSGFLHVFFVYLLIIELGVYLLFSILFSIYESKKVKQFFLFPFISTAYFVSHISYGIGYIVGFIDFNIFRKHTKGLREISLSR